MAMPATPTQALWTLRTIWWVTWISQGVLAFFMVVYRRPVEGGHPFWLAVCLLGLVLCTGAGYFCRSQCYKRYWRGDTITPRGYVRGNVALLIMLGVASSAALLGVALTGRLWPYLLVAGASWALATLNFPHGKPMQTHTPCWS